MKYLIEKVFLYQNKDMKNAQIESQLKHAKEKLIDKVDQEKFTKEFINEFISMYDNEQLYNIMKLVRLKIQKRSRDEINNTL